MTNFPDTYLRLNPSSTTKCLLSIRNTDSNHSECERLIWKAKEDMLYILNRFLQTFLRLMLKGLQVCAMLGD